MSMLLCGLALIAQVSTVVPPKADAPPPAPPQVKNEGLITEPPWLGSVVDAITSRSRNEGVSRDGFYLTFGAGVSGAGWIAAGPGYRRHLAGDRLFADVSGVLSWRQYAGARARIELRPLANHALAIGAQVLRQDWTQVQYFGMGQESVQDNRSLYRLRASDVTVYATMPAGHQFELRMRGGLLSRPRITEASGWHKGNFPDAQSLFTSATASGLFSQPRFLHADVSVSADTLDHPGHPTRGHLVEAAISVYRDRDLGQFSFRRYELTAAAFVPIVGNLWTVGVRGTAIASGTSGANQVPFYMLPSLGHTLLRGFDTGRFHDRNLIALNVETRIAIFSHLDAALFADLGEVAPRFGSLNRSDLQSSLGAGLRFHTGATTFLRVDAARAGGGGWRVVVKLSDSLSFPTQQRWASVVPISR